MAHEYSLADAQRHIQKYGECNVKLFGALGDGQADDTAAVKQALAHFPKCGGVLYFPPGKYRLCAKLCISVDQPIVLRGAGPDVSTLWWGPGVKEVGIVITQAVPNNELDVVNYTLVEQLTFVCAKKRPEIIPGSAMLTLDLSGQIAQSGEKRMVCQRADARCKVVHCNFRGSFAAAIECVSAHTTDIAYCNVHGAGHDAPASRAGIRFVGGGSPTNHTISNTRIFHVEHGIIIESETAGLGRLEGIKVSNCNVVAVMFGIYTNAALDLNVTASHIHAMKDCIYAGNIDQSVIMGNLLYHMQLDGAGVHVVGTERCTNNIISNNIVVNIKAQKTTGILLEGVCNSTIISGNQFQGCHVGIVGGDNCNNAQVIGNGFCGVDPQQRQVFSGKGCNIIS